MGHGQYPSEFPPHLPPIVARDGYRVLDSPLPPFMYKKWLKPGSERLDSYPLPEIDSPFSSPEVGSPPGKRLRPFADKMSPRDLQGLHRSTLQELQPPEPPQVPIIDLDEVHARWMASPTPQKLTPKTPELPESRHLVNELATTRALPSEDPADLDPDALRLAVQGLSLGAHQRTLLALAEKNYEEMAEFAKSLNRDEGAALWTQARNWMVAADPSERDPIASQLMALLVLFTPYTPSRIDLVEFMGLLPLNWPRALEHLRKDCLNIRAALVAERATAARSVLLDKLYERYRDS